MQLSAQELREAIVAEIDQLLVEGDRPVRPLSDTDVLLETGLDSLGFAVLVARLEDTFGYDPFTETEEPVYPQTLAELCRVYEREPRPA